MKGSGRQNKTAQGNEQGVILIWFAMLIVGLFGLASMVIDLGLVRATRASMVYATEEMALEGMRWRDDEGETGRRERAREVLARHFDDNLQLPDRSQPEPVAAPDAIGFGAGPLFSYSGGIGPLMASAMPVFAGPSSSDRVWKPQLEFGRNLTNDRAGDQVAGTFVAGAPDIETSDYFRSDFTASTPANANVAPAFLARLRRSPESETDDSLSAGPAHPFLFGLGTAIQGGDGFNPRTDGLTLRATAIASATRALAVSTVPSGLLGGSSGEFAPGQNITLAPIGFLATGPFAELAPGIEQALTIDNGNLVDGSAVWGNLLVSAPRRVGGAASLSTVATDQPRTLTIVSQLVDLGGLLSVASFNLAELEITGSTMQITLRPSTLLPVGATIHDVTARAALATNPTLAQAHQLATHPVLAPTLVR